MEESKQILVMVTEVQANLKHLSKQMEGVTQLAGTVVEVAESTKSAHNRINDLKSDFDEKLKNQKVDYEKKFADQKEDYEEKLKGQERQFEKLEGGIIWLKRAVGGGAITAIFGLILFFATK